MSARARACLASVCAVLVALIASAVSAKARSLSSSSRVSGNDAAIDTFLTVVGLKGCDKQDKSSVLCNDTLQFEEDVDSTVIDSADLKTCESVALEKAMDAKNLAVFEATAADINTKQDVTSLVINVGSTEEDPAVVPVTDI